MDKTMTTDRKPQRHRILLAALALVLALAMLPAAAATQAYAAMNEIFTVTNEDGIAITYRVFSEDVATGTGTVQVGLGTPVSRAIAQDTAGALIIPKTVENGGITYTVNYISPFTFSGCSALTSVIIPDSVENIGMVAFGNCTGLTSFTIPASVAGIASAFSGCSSLATLIFEGATAPDLVNTGQFTGVAASGTLYYPEGATGYDPAVFQAKGLPVDWEFVAVLPVGEPASGDLDGDGKTTTAEALVVARAVVSGTSGLTEAQIAAADMDGDGVLTMSDVVRALRKAVAL
jgi:hypothetical protein